MNNLGDERIDSLERSHIHSKFIFGDSWIYSFAHFDRFESPNLSISDPFRALNFDLDLVKKIRRSTLALHYRKHISRPLCCEPLTVENLVLENPKLVPATCF